MSKFDASFISINSILNRFSKNIALNAILPLINRFLCNLDASYFNWVINFNKFVKVVPKIFSYHISNYWINSTTILSLAFRNACTIIQQQALIISYETARANSHSFSAKSLAKYSRGIQYCKSRLFHNFLIWISKEHMGKPF